MGIVRLLGRGAVRRSTDACGREGRRAWTEAVVVGEWRVVVRAPAVEVVAAEGAKQRAADQTCVRRDPWAESESAFAS
jgi:hypothetical protein